MSENIAPLVNRVPRRVVDSCASLHSVLTRYWSAEEERYMAATRVIPTRMQQVVRKAQQQVTRRGDQIVADVKNLFFNGLGNALWYEMIYNCTTGITWGPDQVRVFDAFLASCLPLIYNKSWPEEKARVLREFEIFIF